MEFQYTKMQKVETKRKNEGKEFWYHYFFIHCDESIKATVTIKTEEPIEIEEGAIVDFDFQNQQTKVKK